MNFSIVIRICACLLIPFSIVAQKEINSQNTQKAIPLPSHMSIELNEPKTAIAIQNAHSQSSAEMAMFNDLGNQFRIGINGSNMGFGAIPNEVFIHNRANTDLVFYTNDIPYLKLEKTGILSHTKSGTGFIHTDGVVQLGTFVNSLGGEIGTKTNHKLGFYTNNQNQSMTLTTNGRLGIGNTAPAERLDVNGNLRVAGEIIFPEKQKILTIPHVSFTEVSTFVNDLESFPCNGNASTWYDGSDYALFNNKYVYISDDGSFVSFQYFLGAPVHLPDGAKIGKIKAFLDAICTNGCTKQSFCLQLIAVELSSASTTIITTGNSAFQHTDFNSEKHFNAEVNVSPSHTVNNSVYAYYIRISTGDLARGFGIKGAQVFYKITKPY